MALYMQKYLCDGNIAGEGGFELCRSRFVLDEYSVSTKYRSRIWGKFFTRKRRRFLKILKTMLEHERRLKTPPLSKVALSALLFSALRRRATTLQKIGYLAIPACA
jgi:hypothetical protein